MPSPAPLNFGLSSCRDGRTLLVLSIRLWHHFPPIAKLSRIGTWFHYKFWLYKWLPPCYFTIICLFIIYFIIQTKWWPHPPKVLSIGCVIIIPATTFVRLSCIGQNHTVLKDLDHLDPKTMISNGYYTLWESNKMPSNATLITHTWWSNYEFWPPNLSLQIHNHWI